MSLREKTHDIQWPELCIGCGLVKSDMKRRISKERVIHSVERTPVVRVGYAYGGVPRDTSVIHYNEDIHLCKSCSRRMRRHQLRNVLVDIIFAIFAAIILLYAGLQIPLRMEFEKQVMIYISSVAGIFIVGVGLDTWIHFLDLVNPHKAYYSSQHGTFGAKFSFSNRQFCEAFFRMNRIEDRFSCDYNAFKRAEEFFWVWLLFGLIIGIFAVWLIQTFLGSIFPWLVG
ncbi:MAG: hypothetical protein ACFFAY_06195 [Promethearchaeota archaeon]